VDMLMMRMKRKKWIGNFIKEKLMKKRKRLGKMMIIKNQSNI